MPHTINDMTPEAALAAVQWLASMGADEGVGDVAINRFAAPATPEQAPTAKLLERKAAPSSPVMADRSADAEAAIADARKVAAACNSLSDIEEALSRCVACPLSRTATRPNCSSWAIILVVRMMKRESPSLAPKVSCSTA